MDLVPGVRLGPYEVVALLGSGGMGHVYKARDLRLQRDVAIKLLHAERSLQGNFHAQLLREATAAAAVTHPHICTLYDIRQEGDSSFLVMEYLEGETLAARLFKGPFDLPEAIATGIQITEALAAAHANHLIHADLKPGNVMLTASGPKLLDFGLARIRTSSRLHEVPNALTTSEPDTPAMLMGTLLYMAPEQLEGRAVDHRADIFAFGAVLFEMITGRQAFAGRSRPEIIAMILKGEPPSLRLGRPHITPALDALVKTCLAKNPARRWQNSADVAIALRTIGASLVRRRAEPLHGDRASQGLRSLVVLPLDNLTGDPNQQYLADGMTECLTSSMSIIGQLKVISRSSAMKYRASTKTVTQIATELGVDGLIRGAVGRSDAGVSVSVELMQRASSEPLWREAYDRPLTDLFRVQGEIAETIAAEIYLKLTATERRRFRSHHATSPEINEAYLRGRYYWNRDTPEALQRSFQYLSVAVQRDPDYAAAQAALADWYLSAGYNNLMPVPEGLAKAKTAALRALELDPGLAEAYACLGRIAMHECDVQRARAEFETALRLNPNLVEPLVWSARLLTNLTLHDEAIVRVERAKRLDPVSPRPYLAAAAAYYIAGDPERAIEAGREALEFEPRLAPSHYFIGMSQLLLGRSAEAIESLETAVQVGQRHAARVAGLAVALIRAGRHEDGLLLLGEMRDRATLAEISPYYFAEVFLALGDVEKALTYLRRSYELRIPDMIGIAVDPLLRSLKDHPEFRQIVRDLGLSPGSGH